MNEPSLASFVEEVCGESHLRVEADLGDGFVRLLTSEAERRQAAHDIRSSEDIVIEMLRNARDAHAKNIFVAVSREGDTRTIIMLDDGDGIPASMHERVFDSRVTSKLDSMHVDKWGVHGRGMALYSVKVNAESAAVIASGQNLGCSIRVTTNLANVGEKTDQSSFPYFEVTGTGSYAMRGPRNIVRTCCEFALESRHFCSVYLGSPTEIAATLFAFGDATLSRSCKLFCDDETQIPVCKRLALAGDPDHFTALCSRIGLDMSSRSSRRILDGEIEAVEPLLEQLEQQSFTKEGENTNSSKGVRKAKRSSSGKGLKSVSLMEDDKAALKSAASHCFAELAPRYYLEPDVDVEVRIANGKLSIDIPLERIL